MDVFFIVFIFFMILRYSYYIFANIFSKYFVIDLNTIVSKFEKSFLLWRIIVVFNLFILFSILFSLILFKLSCYLTHMNCIFNVLDLDSFYDISYQFKLYLDSCQEIYLGSCQKGKFFILFFDQSWIFFKALMISLCSIISYLPMFVYAVLLKENGNTRVNLGMNVLNIFCLYLLVFYQLIGIFSFVIVLATHLSYYMFFQRRFL